MRITQRDVAREAGVSQTVVSDVLHDRARGRVSPETRQRILDAAQRLAYRPNATAQALRLGQSRQVAYITSRTDIDNFSALAEEVVSGLAATFAERQLRVAIEVAGSYRQIPERLHELVASGVCDSGIVRVFEEKEALWSALKRLEIPLVVIGQCPDPELLSIAHDVPGIIRAAQAYLAERQHRRIAMLSGPRRSQYFRLVEASWREGLARLGLSDQWTAEATGREAAEVLMNEWLQSPDGPSAIVCLNEHVALGASRAVVRRGLRVGKDVELVVIGSTTHSWLYEPGTLLFGTDLAGIGRRAAAELIRSLAEPSNSGAVRILPELIRL
jgi:LacI family transcriptional regulator